MHLETLQPATLSRGTCTLQIGLSFSSCIPCGAVVVCVIVVLRLCCLSCARVVSPGAIAACTGRGTAVQASRDFQVVYLRDSGELDGRTAARSAEFDRETPLHNLYSFLVVESSFRFPPEEDKAEIIFEPEALGMRIFRSGVQGFRWGWAGWFQSTSTVCPPHQAIQPIPRVRPPSSSSPPPASQCALPIQPAIQGWKTAAAQMRSPLPQPQPLEPPPPPLKGGWGQRRRRRECVRATKGPRPMRKVLDGAMVPLPPPALPIWSCAVMTSGRPHHPSAYQADLVL